MHDLSPIAWALRPLKNYADFSGRATRAEFWWFTLFTILFYAAIWIVFAVVGGSATGSEPSMAIVGMGVVGIAMMLSYLALLIPMIAVQVRRLHDTDRSGWWLGAFWILYAAYFFLIFSRLMPVIAAGSVSGLYGAGAIGIFAIAMFVYSITLLVFYCLPGTRGANRFGEDPYGADVEEVFA